jgi:hypothetical protein
MFQHILQKKVAVKPPHHILHKTIMEQQANFGKKKLLHHDSLMPIYSDKIFYPIITTTVVHENTTA